MQRTFSNLRPFCKEYANYAKFIRVRRTVTFLPLHSRIFRFRYYFSQRCRIDGSGFIEATYLSDSRFCAQ